VVIPDLRVKGVAGLRVIDASVFVSSCLVSLPIYPTGNVDELVATIHIFGERGADLVKVKQAW
jgi:choline dehydrogenase-like flavoprotein